MNKNCIRLYHSLEPNTAIIGDGFIGEHRLDFVPRVGEEIEFFGIIYLVRKVKYVLSEGINPSYVCMYVKEL